MPDAGSPDNTAAVLLVDDQPSNLDALEAALDGLEARVVRAAGADDALKHVLAEDFAVILLDVEMPGMNGFETAKLIRSRERSRATPIIFMTARDRDKRTTLAGLESGAVDVLYQPLDPTLVRAKVAVFLELDRLRGRSAQTTEVERANTRLRGVVAELKAARQRAEAAQQAKDQFVATMSHEIRTPINAIMGYAELIELGLAGPVTEGQRDYLARLSTSSHHLLELVNDILDLSKIEANEMDVVRDAQWTGPVVASALELTSAAAVARNIRVVDVRPGEPGVPYIGDERRVRQILLNLLSNAIKFTEPGGTVTVESRIDREALPQTNLHGGGPWACIAVSDTGIGVAPEDQARIFEPFQQVESGHTRTRGGTGLGLAISHRLAHLMGGDLTIKSGAGTGSIFTLCLPAANADETPQARSARATPATVAVGVRGLCEIGEALRDEVHTAIVSYATRLRSDPETPAAMTLRQPDLEDHAVTFLADIAQSLIIVGESDPQAGDLLADATQIQRAISERHGARRRRQGWTEASIARDFRVLGEEVERVIRAKIPASSEDTDQAIGVVRRLIERAEEISLRSWREAGQRSASSSS